MNYLECSESLQANIFDLKEPFLKEEHVPQVCTGDFGFSPFFPFVVKTCPDTRCLNSGVLNIILVGKLAIEV